MAGSVGASPRRMASAGLSGAHGSDNVGGGAAEGGGGCRTALVGILGSREIGEHRRRPERVVPDQVGNLQARSLRHPT